MRILLAPFGSHGDVHPFLGLGHALAARGHEIHVLTASIFRELVEKNGFSFAPIGSDAEFQDTILNPHLWNPRRSLRVLFGNRDLMGRHLREGYQRLLERHIPGKTVIVAGSLAFWARIANEKPGIPLASIHLQPSLLPSLADPPEFYQLRMRTWWPGAFKSFLYWFGDRFILSRYLAPAIGPFRRELGLPELGRSLVHWLNSPQRIIGLFPEWYGNAPDWPPEMRVAGFVRFDQANLESLSPELEAFLQHGEPPIAFTFGTAMRHGRRYFEAAVEACRILGKRGLFLAHGKEQVPESLPPSIFHAEYAPFSAVFPRSAAVVHHGGIGTVAQSLASGVPQLVMPISFDQPDNARRIVRLGAGARLWPSRFTGKRVARALFQLLDSPATLLRCNDLAHDMKQADGTQRVCTMIEELVEKETQEALSRS